MEAAFYQIDSLHLSRKSIQIDSEKSVNTV